MKKILFAFVMVLLVGGVQALGIGAPAEAVANTAISVYVEFDSLSSFSEAVVQLDGSNIVELYTYRGNLFIDSTDRRRVLAENVDGQTLYLLLNGFSGEGSRIIRAEEIGKEEQSATMDIFIPVSKEFEEEYRQEFDSLKATIMSYANDIDGLKARADELDALIASKASSSELQGKVDELRASIDSLQASLDDSVSQLQQSVDEQAAKVGALEEETKEFTSTGFISFGNLQNEGLLPVIGAIIVIVIIAVLVARGKVTLPKLPKPKKKEKTIYTPSKVDEKITSQVLEEAGNKKEEPQAVGRWAFKGGSWKPKGEAESEAKPSSIGDLIKRD